MRTKLMRAMAHLKAARAHVKAANEILRGGYAWSEATAVVQIFPPIDAASGVLRESYALELWNAVAPVTRTP